MEIRGLLVRILGMILCVLGCSPNQPCVHARARIYIYIIINGVQWRVDNIIYLIYNRLLQPIV